jgi:glycosyltransferase involved in cell wall biosynthesis
MPDVEFSLIVPVRGRQEELNTFLAPAHNFPRDESWELIVVDDCSEEVLAVDQSIGTSFRVPTGSGAASCRNQGAKIARGRYLVFLSVFLELPNDYIVRLKDSISSQDADFYQHPIVISPRINANHFQVFLGNQAQRVSTKATTIPVKQSLFTAAVIEKKIFLEVGGFDESMRHYGGHEMDFIYRLDRSGYKNRRVMDSITLERTSVSDQIKTVARLREYGNKGLPGLLIKHPALEPTILKHKILWGAISLLYLAQLMETFISTLVASNIKLPKDVYRLYLHLVVRNAWESR